MQNQLPSRLFQRIKPLSTNAVLPQARFCEGPMSMLVETRAKAIVELRSKIDELELQIAPNPLMHRPGEVNPLGEYSPYLPPLCIPGIRRAPRPIEEDPIPGSEHMLKIRRPSATGPYAEYREDIGRWHTFVDEHISSCLPGLYIMVLLFIMFEPHNLTFKEFVQYLWES